jgi:predicted SAM-dependent methyltransferase
MAMKIEYVQYGCGWCAPETWLNFDASPTLRFERLPLVGSLYTRNAKRFPSNVRYGDITRGLPVAPNSCSAIYCSHVLEHLALDDFEVALQNTFTYLKPGGVFRFVLPDLEQLARTYLSNSSDTASQWFMEKSCLGHKHRPRGMIGFIKTWLSNSNHLWMWDERSITARLKQHGFYNIRRTQFGDAEDKKFNEVEDKGRFEGCLAMQCSK